MKRHWFKILGGPVYEAQRPLLAALKKMGFEISDYEIGTLRDAAEGRELEIIFKNCVPDGHIEKILAVKYLLFCEP